jgi:hypothetical protein
VAELDDDIFDLCLPVWRLELPPLEEGPENDYRLLVNEVMRLIWPVAKVLQHGIDTAGLIVV